MMSADGVLLVVTGVFFFSSRRRHTRCALVTGVQTCALPIFLADKVAARAGGREGPIKVEVPMFEALAAFLLNEHLAGATFAPNGAVGYPQIGRASCRERVCQYV